jgi:hypothetical protein
MKHLYPLKRKLENSNLSVTENVFGPKKTVEIDLKLCLIDENCQAKKQQGKELMKINIIEYLKLSSHINLFPALLPEIYLRRNIMCRVD